VVAEVFGSRVVQAIVDHVPAADAVETTAQNADAAGDPSRTIAAALNAADSKNSRRPIRAFLMIPTFTMPRVRDPVCPDSSSEL
jgi:hypothetical protein